MIGYEVDDVNLDHDPLCSLDGEEVPLVEAFGFGIILEDQVIFFFSDFISGVQVAALEVGIEADGASLVVELLGFFRRSEVFAFQRSEALIDQLAMLVQVEQRLEIRILLLVHVIVAAVEVQDVLWGSGVIDEMRQRPN